MSAITIIDNALDRYVSERRSRGVDPDGVRVKTLAHIADVSNGEMSTMLQSYRIAQARDGATRYVIAANSYGRNARWHILAKPGTDPRGVREARTAQTRWVAEDLTQRWFSDLKHEISPGLQDAETDEAIRAATEFLTGQFEQVKRLVERILSRTS